jgi:hypothetical protein
MVKVSRPTVDNGGRARIEEAGAEASIEGLERLQVHVTESQYRKLKQYGVDHRMRVSAIVRAAIDAWLATPHAEVTRGRRRP